ncbi:universal stress protein [Ramlibacter monticola]|uniref:Universal stress protein n=1 Tax=Ramlibacter monticola TaxID=1926872 RepID=A0A937CT93_9BURK|nr:universal stress protein [Ramlibacter monticola]MBL0390827.1 universal stress protein [Ramlibacter monticola]
MPADLRQILVHLDPTLAAARRLAAANTVAKNLRASVTALYAATPGFAELPYAPAIGGPGLSASLAEIDERRRSQARKVFDEARRASGTEAAWAQTSRVPITETFAQQALFADLLVLGQRDPADEDAASVPADFVESVLLACGRPALVVPHIGAPAAIGSTVAIAWKETPEAARAVTAALPFLRQAKRVHVLSWGEETPAPVGGQPLDLERYLGAHGVRFTWDRAGAERQQIGELLLSRAFDLGADLLVMGCYGHSRAREWILGGASRTILQSMTLPVLMMH